MYFLIHYKVVALKKMLNNSKRIFFFVNREIEEKNMGAAHLNLVVSVTQHRDLSNPWQKHWKFLSYVSGARVGWVTAVASVGGQTTAPTAQQGQ